MRGNRRGEGQDDGNLPADILCVSCEPGLPTVALCGTLALFHSPAFVPLATLLYLPPSGPGPLITAGNHEITKPGEKKRNDSFFRVFLPSAM